MPTSSVLQYARLLQVEGGNLHNKTGYVIKLDLHSEEQTQQPLIGEINPSLIQLQNLQYLDLSDNFFGGNGIPDFNGSFTQLRDLKLVGIGVEGPIPHQLGNLSNLNTLDLSWNIGINTNDLGWLSGLSSLRYLDLSLLNLSRAVNWLESMSILSLSHVNLSTSLEVLDLSSNNLSSSIFTWVENVGGGSLIDLQLNSNHLKGSIPNAFAYMSSLEYLDLSDNELEGSIPNSFQNLWSLGTLPHLSSYGISFNNLSGPLPDFSGAPSLQILSLSHNKINGILPESIGNLSNLKLLDLSSNSLNGTVSEYKLSNLYNLQTLDVSDNSLTFNLSFNWIPPFQLQYLKMSSCKLGTNFPQWLETQKNLSVLDMSNVGISEEIPGWFWNLTRLQYLNLSNNLSGCNYHQ
ncbi:Leucine-rich repeat receptor kinase protein THICK TASSEL DWARF1 [Spatholobus suberectus]|nr:Leucine-rich repeat receptor kinase protein THICK TASSEL DWARF1 [Spatholobus suberectus]